MNYEQLINNGQVGFTNNDIKRKQFIITTELNSP